MPFKRAVVLRDLRLDQPPEEPVRVSMPFRRAAVLRVAYNTCDCAEGLVFQCPLRRAWVLRVLDLPQREVHEVKRFNAL